ncbi:hypothetical protein SAMN02745116_02240 [Pilibacter termitis]|uniref:Uncharacterized protein n=1 Tax=Pilibacter termitis TaxID=263852 RepID=A0A1T4QN02_9ENTE|nr:hypothetical protein SAMN02745116_02240 [Pilibacter termitis]
MKLCLVGEVQTVSPKCRTLFEYIKENGGISVFELTYKKMRLRTGSKRMLDIWVPLKPHAYPTSLVLV